MKEKAAIINLEEAAETSTEALANLAYMENSISGFLTSLGYNDLTEVWDELSAKLFDEVNECISGEKYETD